MTEQQQVVYEVAVLGAGVVGSATAYYLASRGTAPVLLLEQFDAQHTRGSSHGGSRITRKAYPKPHYVQMMKDAFPMWDEIETKSNKQLYLKTGILLFGDNSDPEYQNYLDSMKECGVPYEIFTGSEANRRYPHQLKIPDSYSCCIEHEGGILRANKAVATLQELFVSHGGVLLDNHRISRIIPGPVVTVETEKTTFQAKKIIVTAGPWTNQLLQQTGLTLPLRPLRVEAVYWRTENPQWFLPNHLPVFAYCLTSKLYYGIPILEYPGLIKICSDNSVEVDPDLRDKDPNNVTVSSVKGFIEQYMQGVEHESPAVVEYCMITKTPDDDAIIDKHPEYPNIIIGAGFSGHGFKEAPVIGRMLTELALNQPLSYDLSHYSIARFNNS